MNNIIECVEKQICVGCRNCYWVCQSNAIEMKENKEGFLIPNINSNCKNCGLCRKKCPALKARNTSTALAAYGYSASDNNILLNAASGGIASNIALSFVATGGYVCGCVFLQNNKVGHIVSNNQNEIKMMASSKYVQSDLQESFPQIKELLKKEEKVLFIGTPCQVDALKSFLGNDYPTLYLIDLICHGVPSPLLLRKYVGYLENKEKSPISNINFRFKKNEKWDLFFSFIRDADKKRVIRYLSDDKYGSDFLKGINYRECCYSCNYSSVECRPGDLTIGDFWGIKELFPEHFNKKGLSSVIVNSNKGVELFNQYTNESDRFSCDVDCIVKYQTNLQHPTLRPTIRDTYYDNLNDDFFERKREPHSLFQTIKRLVPRKIINILVKIKNGVK